MGRHLLSNAQWQRVDELFHEALAAPPPERSHLLSGANPMEREVREEVSRLLALHDRAGTFLEPAPLAPLTESTGQPPNDQCEAGAPLCTAGIRLGRFRLESVLAVGGMGEVWRACRDDAAYKQKVAVKVLRGAGTRPVDQYLFLRERQTLAALEHPSITRLIDGGATADGRPYLVMELVDGTPIDDFSDRHRLSVHERLELLLTVCAAVHYAHQHLVVHRDLKPSNILVTPDGLPKLLDFGIADLLGAEARSGDTQRHRAFSPDYAAPEQLRGEACTTATDVYALGLILHKLLCGRLPVQPRGPLTRLADTAPAESSLQTAEVEKPSLGAELSPKTAAARSTTPARLRRLLRGDLQWIVRRALHPDPERRYPTAADLESDLLACLSHRPVAARPGRAWYRAGCLVRRNPITVAIAACFSLALVAVLSVAIIGWQRARSEEAIATAATKFTEAVFASMSPYLAGSDPTVMDLLDEASRRAAVDLPSQPAVEYEVRMMIARTHASLWQWNPAGDEAARAVALARELYGSSSLELADSLTLLGRAQTWNRDSAAVATQQEAIRIRIAQLGADHPAVAESTVNLAFAHWNTGRTDRAARLYSEGIALYRRTAHANPREYARALFSYASFLIELEGPGEESLALLAEAHSLFEDLSDPPDRYSTVTVFAYGSELMRTGRCEEGADLLQRYLAMTPRENAGHWTVGRAGFALGQWAELQENTETAAQHYAMALRVWLLFGAEQTQGGDARRQLSEDLQEARSPGDRLAVLERLVELLQSTACFDGRTLESAAALAGVMPADLATARVEAVFAGLQVVGRERCGAPDQTLGAVQLAWAGYLLRQGDAPASRLLAERARSNLWPPHEPAELRWRRLDTVLGTSQNPDSGRKDER